MNEKLSNRDIDSASKHREAWIEIDRDRCTGHGRCYSLEPALFEPDSEGYSVAVVHALSPGQEVAAERAAASCPEQAISVRR